MEELQVHRYMVIMSTYSTSHGLNVAAIYAQGKWQHHFQCIMELREGCETLLWWNLVWFSDTGAWDGTQGDVHMMAVNGTQMMLNAIVYSAVIVGMMKIAQKGQ